MRLHVEVCICKVMAELGCNEKRKISHHSTGCPHQDRKGLTKIFLDIVAIVSL